MLHLYYWPALDISSCFHPSWKCNFWINQHLFVQEHNTTITFRQFWELIVVINNFSKSFSQMTWAKSHSYFDAFIKWICFHAYSCVCSECNIHLMQAYIIFIMHSGNLSLDSIPIFIFIFSSPHEISHKISCCHNKRSNCFCNIVYFLGNNGVNFQYFFFSPEHLRW